MAVLPSDYAIDNTTRYLHSEHVNRVESVGGREFLVAGHELYDHTFHVTDDRYVPRNTREDLEVLLGNFAVENLTGEDIDWQHFYGAYQSGIGYVQHHDIWTPILQEAQLEKIAHVDTIIQSPTSIVELRAETDDGQTAVCDVYNFDDMLEDEQMDMLDTFFSEVLANGCVDNHDTDATMLFLEPRDLPIFSFAFGDAGLSVVSSKLKDIKLDRIESGKAQAAAIDSFAPLFIGLRNYRDQYVYEKVKKTFSTSTSQREYDSGWGIRIPKKVVISPHY